jgi:hypothetical protein
VISQENVSKGADHEQLRTFRPGSSTAAGGLECGGLPPLSKAAESVSKLPRSRAAWTLFLDGPKDIPGAARIVSTSIIVVFRPTDNRRPGV